MTRPTFRRFLEFGALCTLSAIVLWWFGRKLDWIEVRQAFSHANVYLLGLAIVMVCIVYLIQACRWRSLLAPLGPTRLKRIFEATIVGLCAIFLLGRLGELVRPVVLPLRDPKVRRSASFVTILVERIYDLTVMIILFGANLLWFKPPSHIAEIWSRLRIVGIILLVGAMAGVAGLVWLRGKSTVTIAWLNRRLNSRHLTRSRLAVFLIRTLTQTAKALGVLVDARTLILTLGWTILAWAGIAISYLLVIRAFGVSFGITETVFVLGWSLVGSLVPTPGGAAGPFHAATAVGLIFLGVTRETAAAISIVVHLIGFGPAMLFGFFYLLRGDINLTRLRSLTSSAQAVEEEDSIAEALLTRRR